MFVHVVVAGLFFSTHYKQLGVIKSIVTGGGLSSLDAAYGSTGGLPSTYLCSCILYTLLGAIGQVP